MNRNTLFFLLFPTLIALTPFPGRGGTAVPPVANEPRFAGGMNVFTTEEPVRVTLIPVPGGPVVAADRLGRKVSAVPDRNGQIDFGRLTPGYYRLESGGRDLGGFAVTIPPAQYPNDPSTTLGLDYAMNTAGLPLRGDALRRELERNALMARKAGVKRVRERLRTSGQNREIVRRPDGSFVIDEKGWTSLCLRVNRAAGFAVCAVSQMTPAAINLNRNPKKVPADLDDTWNLYSAIGRAWGPLLEGIEIGNEIDLRVFYEGTAGEYAAYAKTASLALRAAAPGLLVVQSSFARPAMQLKAALADNGVRSFFDVFNYHVYGEIGRNMNDYARYIMSRENYPRAWCTETGKDVGQWDWNRPGIEDFPAAYSGLIARSLGPIYAENLAAGAEKTYFFYWRYGAELTVGAILDKKYRVTERYAALATVNRMLGNALYRGSKIDGDTRAHLFADGHGGLTLIVWNDRCDAELKVGATGPWELVRYSGETVDKGTADGQLTLKLTAGMPVYLRVAALSDPLTDLRRPAPAAAAIPPVAPLVAELRPDGRTEYDISLAAFQFKPGERHPVTLTVRNFDRKPYRGRVALSVPAPWQIRPESIPVELAPGRKTTAAVEVVAPAERNGGRLMRTVKAVAPGIAPAAIRVALNPAAIVPQQVKPAFRNLNSGIWACPRNSALLGFRTTPGRQGPRFRIDFSAPGPRMFWPELSRLPDGLTRLDWGGWDAVRVRMRVYATRPGTWFMFYATELKGARYAGARLLADTPGEHELLFPFSGFTYVTENSAPDAPEFSFDPDRLRTFGLGSNNLNARALKDTLYAVDYEITGIDLLKY